MRTVTIHEKEMEINKNKLKSIVADKGMEFKDLHEKVVDHYGLDLSYKGFMSLISNRNTWKLLYAWAITDVLNIDIKDIFIVVDVDVEKKAKDKEVWKNRYQNKKE